MRCEFLLALNLARHTGPEASKQWHARWGCAHLPDQTSWGSRRQAQKARARCDDCVLCATFAPRHRAVCIFLRAGSSLAGRPSCRAQPAGAARPVNRSAGLVQSFETAGPSRSSSRAPGSVRAPRLPSGRRLYPPRVVGSRAAGSPRSPPRATAGSSGMLAEERCADLVGQTLAAAAAEYLVALAVTRS